MAKFAGKYRLVKSEMFEEYLKAKGAGYLAIKMATALSPYMEIWFEEGDDGLEKDSIWRLKIYTAIKTVTDMTFKLEEEFDHTRMDGTKCKVIMKVEGNKLIEEETPINNSQEAQTNIREWIDDEHVVLTLRCKNVEAKRYFERI